LLVFSVFSVISVVNSSPSLFAAAPIPPLSNSPPRTPREELATFRVPADLVVELVACEPDVVDPVAMAFDEHGRIFVAEMRGYPNKGVGTGFITSGRIKVLEDRDGDGFYETSRVYADHLRFPTGLMPWKRGLLVANAPDLMLLEDTKGTGRADRQRVLYTGFDLANIQQLLNSLQWGLDNWIHACAGGSGGTITSGEKPDSPPVALRGRGIRFHPDVPGSLEPTSGGGQYGLSADDWGRWFTATNSQHLRHIILPDHYLRRNPALAVGKVTLDIPEHGAACKVFRTSPFEAWRVERTTRRAGGPDARRFPTTELVPGGFVTSACSPLVYTAPCLPERFRGNVFVCDPANNLILRDVLTPQGATFRATRAPEDARSETEFFSSTDNWCRPVHLTLGPDGAIYVLDFYREVIETPLSLPPDILARLNVESRGRGRIWRITTKGTPRRNPALRKAPTRELVEHLNDRNSWWRLTAQRLLVERQDRSAVPLLSSLVREARLPVARAHALWTLEGLGGLTEELITAGLHDSEPGVREQALQLAESRLAPSAALRKEVAGLADDSDARVRFQLALSLGQADAPELTAALARLARRADLDTWTQTALLSSTAGPKALGLLETLGREAAFRRDPSAARLALLTRLAALVGVQADDAALGRALALLGSTAGDPEPFQAALLDGLGQGLQNSSRSLRTLWDAPPASLRESIARAKPLFEKAARIATNEKQEIGPRTDAIRLLGRGPFAPLEAVFPTLVTPQTPPEVQLAAVRALGAHDSRTVAELLLRNWTGYGPAVRREVVEALFARADRLPALLTAVEKKEVQLAQVDAARWEQLRRHPSPAVRTRAARLLADRGTPDRAKVVEAYRPALELKADGTRGKMIFQKVCATCHRLDGVGVEVGPDLLSALRNKSSEQLLFDILDPSREVDPRFVNYIVTTRRGQVHTGIIAAETASSITLRRGEKVEEVILRAQIDTIEGTGKSLMPDGLETQLTRQDLADLIAWLRFVGRGS
jgi:putative membrane-bound dehydrogenase-like protein